MKERLDILLVERRLVESRTKAQWLIKNGFVDVNGIKITKPGKLINNASKIQLKKIFPYVGRGGLKLEAALKNFKISVDGKICADIGASIGGFTDCLIKYKAKKVYAIDIAEDILHPSLICKNEQIIKLLGVDARNLKKLDEQVDIVSIDITFASLRTILPNTKNYLKKKGDIIVLVKPLFETDFYNENFFVAIKNSKILKQILIDFINWSTENGFFPYGIIQSPILGKGGALEFLVHLRIDKINKSFNYLREIENLIDKINNKDFNYSDN